MYDTFICTRICIYVHAHVYSFRTPYTRFERHSYIDPDYALTDKEAANRTKHRNYYSNYVKEQQTNRIKRKNEMYMFCTCTVQWSLSNQDRL